MDHFTRQKIKKLANLYLRNHNEGLNGLAEINEEYSELFPMIEEISNQIAEEKRAEIERKYNILVKDYDELKVENTEMESKNKQYQKLEKIAELSKGIIQNQRELSKLLSQI